MLYDPRDVDVIVVQASALAESEAVRTDAELRDAVLDTLYQDDPKLGWERFAIMIDGSGAF